MTEKKAYGSGGRGEAVEFYRPEDYAPEESMGYLMRMILSEVKQQVEQELEACGLTHAQWVPLLKLYLGQASTVAEVARGCQLDAGATTRLLDRMEAKGLLRRVRSEEDRRVVHIELTEEGRRAASRIPEVLSRVQNAHLAGFSAEEWNTLKSYLRRILANAQALAAQGEKNP
ncbi:MarR family transcriptional regulator [Ramlibacter sp. 2FC]|uniref:MarR family winged helix-turn-helix transcriptional regulator n=1 Tax=Ramlibacter sp. 2FC TaxID=2502188 RepID=UPI0010F56F30|nr:MarR family transcriptional regulator [Ramlibacter sp. 2FC]